MANVFEQLLAAARGQVGVDHRLIQSILDQGPAAVPEMLRFHRAANAGETTQHRIDLDPLMVDLFRHFQSPDALEFYLDAVRNNPEDVDDGLIQALLPLKNQAVEPLLALYEELGEEQGSDVAFLLAAMRVHDPRVLEVLTGRLEYDLSDAAFCLGMYGDPAARPALEKMLAEIPADDEGLRSELEEAMEALNAPEPLDQPEPFDIIAEYPKHELPPFDVLEESERLEMLASLDAEIRAGAAYSFFNRDLTPKAKAALLHLAQSDAEGSVRGQAWSSLGEATDEAPVREALTAVLNDESKPIEERGGAAVGLYSVADRKEIQKGIEQLYELGGVARIRALEAMWRSLYQPYGKYFAHHLDESDPALLKQVLRGAGYFRLTAQVDKIASFFDRPEPLDELREDALFAYALAMPGETTRGRVKGMLRKIDALAELTPPETELVMFALDERLRLHGMAPVFEAELAAEYADHDHDQEGHDHEPEPGAAEPAASLAVDSAVNGHQKVGRNDVCPCGSGKKYKKCHGA